MEELAIQGGAKAGNLLEWAANPITQVMLWPLIGCLIICCIPAAQRAAIRAVALVTSLLSFCCVHVAPKSCDWPT